MRGLSFFLLLSLWMTPVSAKLYRWVDETGRVQYSDKPPVTAPAAGITELNKSGMVKSTPTPAISQEERDKQQALLQQQKEQQRKDRALLQSFSGPGDIDLIRDRRIEMIQSVAAGNVTRLQAALERKARLDKQISRLEKSKRPVPADLNAEMASVKKEINDLEADKQIKRNEIETVRQKAEEDKKRLAELKAASKK